MYKKLLLAIMIMTALFVCSGVVATAAPNRVSVVYANGGFFQADSSGRSTGVKYSGAAKDITSVTIADKMLQHSALLDCTNLTSVTFPEGFIGFDTSAFENCTSLERIVIPNSVSSIPNAAFRGCTKLKEIALPPSMSMIGEYAFEGCASLKAVTLPSTLSSIRKFAFSGCASLTDVTIPNGVTVLSEGLFSGCTKLKKVAFSPEVTEFGNAVFKNCESLESIILPENITDISASLLYGCSSLTNVVIPKKVTNIDSAAFCNCTSLTNMTIPAAVMKLNSSAFENCTSLTSITVPRSLRFISENAFTGCPNLTIYSKTYSRIYSHALKYNIPFKDTKEKPSTPPKTSALILDDAINKAIVISEEKGSKTVNLKLGLQSDNSRLSFSKGTASKLASTSKPLVITTADFTYTLPCRTCNTGYNITIVTEKVAPADFFKKAPMNFYDLVHFNKVPKLEKVKKQVGTHPIVKINIESGIEILNTYTEPITVTIPYTLRTKKSLAAEGKTGKEENARDISIIYSNITGSFRYGENCKYDKEAETITFTLPSFGKYAVCDKAA